MAVDTQLLVYAQYRYQYLISIMRDEKGLKLFKTKTNVTSTWWYQFFNPPLRSDEHFYLSNSSPPHILFSLPLIRYLKISHNTRKKKTLTYLCLLCWWWCSLLDKHVHTQGVGQESISFDLIAGPATRDGLPCQAAIKKPKVLLSVQIQSKKPKGL